MKMLMQLSEMHNFTPNEKSIAAYILLHKEACLHFSIQKLAKATYTSHSAIVRLTQKLGLTGFKQFKIILAREFQQTTETLSNVDPNSPFGPDDSPNHVAKEIAELMKETIERSYSLLDEALLSQIAGMLHQAEKIFIYALGDSQIRAKSFQNKLLKINKYAVIATELSEWYYHTINLTPQDCVIFLTYHGKQPSFITAAQYFQLHKIPFVTITAAAQSELEKLGGYCIRLPQDEAQHGKIGTFASQLAFEYVLNVLYSCIFQLDYMKNMQTAKKALKGLDT